jgi:NADH-quinone oxidoreductase subunit N
MNTIVISALLGVVMMLSGLVLRKIKHVEALGIISAILVMLSSIYDYSQQSNITSSYFNGMLATNTFTAKINMIVSFGLLAYIFVFASRISRVGLHPAEYFALILFASCGVFIITSYQSLFMLFLGIEIMSIPQYILAGSDKRNLKSNEASLKYFLMGSFSTGFLLMGIALTYGASRSFDVNQINQMFIAAPTVTGFGN